MGRHFYLGIRFCRGNRRKRAATARDCDPGGGLFVWFGGSDLYVHIDMDMHLDHQCRKMPENNLFHDFSVVQIRKCSTKEIRQLAGVGMRIS